MDARAQLCVASYRRLKNLKLVGEDVGIPWQTVYVILRKVGEPVTGDKSRYGSETDKLAAKAERIFSELVPHATDLNLSCFQSKYDALVHGHKVDIKAATLRRGSWAFSLKKQERVADFFVAFAFDVDALKHIFLFPADCMRHYSTVRVAEFNKWWSYRIEAAELAEFMASLSDIQPLRQAA